MSFICSRRLSLASEEPEVEEKPASRRTFSGLAIGVLGLGLAGLAGNLEAIRTKT